MATNNITVTSNFEEIFASLNTLDDAKTVGNLLLRAVKKAHDERVAQLKKPAGRVEAVVRVTREAAPEKPKEEPKPKDGEKPNEEAKPKKDGENKPKPKPEEKPQKEAETLVSVTDTAAVAALGLTFEKYNERCFVLRGNTKPIRKALKEDYKGAFNSHLNGGEGWVFSNKKAEEVAKALGIKINVA